MKHKDIPGWQNRLAAARGEIPVDLLIKGGKVVNVLSGTIEELSVALYEGIIVGFGDYPYKECIEVEGAYLLPGFFDAHIHIESSKLTPERFAEIVVPRGTTAVVADPHEIANVLGVEGVRFMVRNAEGLPIDIRFMIPSCVPATNMETAGAVLSADQLAPLLDEPSILGIGEMMNFPGAFYGDPAVLAKTSLGDGKLPVDGHAPGLSGKMLSAYIMAGPTTDHECTDKAEAEEKLSRGMRIMIREGSTARNMKALLPIITPATERRCMFVSDDRRPGDLMNDGHMDNILRRAVALGLPPIPVIRMVTLNSAEAFGLTRQGAICPGWKGDITIVDNLVDFNVSKVFKDGRLVAEDGKLTTQFPISTINSHTNSVKVEPGVLNLSVPDKGVPVRVIGIVPDQIVTESLSARLPVSEGNLISDTDNDIIKIAVIERHTGKGGHSVAFVKGSGLKKGAIASTVAHDSHNIIVAGVDDESMMTAIKRIAEIGGGQIATCGQEVLAELPLPIAGIITDAPANQVVSAEDRLIEVAHQLGCTLTEPFMALAFLALPVIPVLKLTDRGLVDVNRFQPVDLYL